MPTECFAGFVSGGSTFRDSTSGTSGGPRKTGSRRTQLCTKKKSYLHVHTARAHPTLSYRSQPDTNQCTPRNIISQGSITLGPDFNFKQNKTIKNVLNYLWLRILLGTLTLVIPFFLGGGKGYTPSGAQRTTQGWCWGSNPRQKHIFQNFELSPFTWVVLTLKNQHLKFLLCTCVSWGAYALGKLWSDEQQFPGEFLMSGIYLTLEEKSSGGFYNL